LDPRFRPTLWPGSVLPTPSLQPLDGVEVVDDWVVWPAQTRQRWVDLPPDFYLRELTELAPDELDGVADLARRYGVPFAFDLTDVPLSNLDGPEFQRVTSIPLEYDGGELRGGHHRDHIRLHVETARNAIEIWMAAQKPGGLDELVEPEVTTEVLAELNSQMPQDPPWLASLDELRHVLIQDRVLRFEESLDAALSTYSVGIGDFGRRGSTVYSVAFLQLYNQIVVGGAVRHCANEPCGRSFVHQRGRAQFNQYRTKAVRFCSRECARAQAQRELRRRRRVQ
jgi:hypothetical protein